MSKSDENKPTKCCRKDCTRGVMCDFNGHNLCADHMGEYIKQVYEGWFGKPEQPPGSPAAPMQPTYYVRHPDESYTVADPQPKLVCVDSPAEAGAEQFYKQYRYTHEVLDWPPEDRSVFKFAYAYAAHERERTEGLLDRVAHYEEVLDSAWHLFMGDVAWDKEAKNWRNKRAEKAEAELAALRGQITEIGNVIGAPTCQYSPAVEIQELRQRVQQVSKLVQGALPAPPSGPESKEE